MSESKALHTGHTAFLLLGLSIVSNIAKWLTFFFIAVCCPLTGETVKAVLLVIFFTAVKHQAM